MSTRSTTQHERIDPYLLKLGLVLVLGIVMSMLDTTIVNVALDTLGQDLDAGLATTQWVVTGYMLALAVVIPATGWLTDRYGAKRLFVLGVGLFTAGSGLCAAAWDVDSLITFRVVQGMAGALLMPVAQTILARAAGPERMGRVMTLVGVPALLAPILGPVAGGLIVDHLTWRWMFLINVPVGVASVLISLRRLPADPRPGQSGQRFDFGGLALLGPGLALLVYGLSGAGRAGTFDDAGVWGPMAGGALLVALFVGYAGARGERALIPLAYFRDRAFASAGTVGFMISISVFGVMLLLPLYYQQIQHDSALSAGLLLALQGLGTAVSMPVAGALADKVGPRRVVVTGMTLVALGTLVLTQVQAGVPSWAVAVALVVRGLGFGAAMMPAMAAGYRNLPASAAGHASSVLQIFSRVGGTIGAALMAVILAQAGDFGIALWYATAITAAGALGALLLPGGDTVPAHTQPKEQ
ncbi:DHA2 family efflux MFS transporter permease subunit [Nonomuraea insulae]|uniref:DHA2 family efflux MFS transporter permease subunit n=1 Tax=Nonomuraea insulae TaxID=1616787 RepID=A0ABW1CYV6_9ACTN